MRALTVAPGTANSAQVEEVADPRLSDGAVLVRAVAVGVCGTDREIVSGRYGWAPPGQRRLVIGHELLGIVQEVPADCGVYAGDLVVGILRRPDPVSCAACGVGKWDMCRNGPYTERGIKERNGFGAEFFRVEPDFLVKSIRHSALPACCSNRPAWSPRPGITLSASVSVRDHGNQKRF